jgi:hypothetical protein
MNIAAADVLMKIFGFEREKMEKAEPKENKHGFSGEFQQAKVLKNQ